MVGDPLPVREGLSAPMIFNLIGFQIGWFSCVLGGANQLPWFGVLLSAMILLIHIKRAAHPAMEARLIFAALIIGLMFDGVLLNLHWIAFAPTPHWPDQLPPPWMVVLWGLFASTINISLAWLQHKRVMAILIGAIAGPVAYWSGARLGGLQLTQPIAALIYLSIGWAIAVPVLFKIAALLNTEKN